MRFYANAVLCIVQCIYVYLYMDTSRVCSECVGGRTGVVRRALLSPIALINRWPATTTERQCMSRGPTVSSAWVWLAEPHLWLLPHNGVFTWSFRSMHARQWL